MTTYVEIGGKIKDSFKRKIIIEKDKKEEAIKKYDFIDTYSTIYEYDNKDQDRANFIAPLYIDLDADDLIRDYEKLKRDLMLLTRKLKIMFNLSDDNLQIFFSGSKGFHVLVPHEIFGLEYGREINNIYKSIAIELKSYTITKSVDTRIYDYKRLFREPNSINSKTGLYKVQVNLDDLRNMTYEDIIEYASQPKEIRTPNKEFNDRSRKLLNSFIEEIKERQRRTINHKVAREMLTNKELLPCVKYILQNGAVKGGRNNTAMALASALYQRDLSDEQKILDIMKEWNETKLDEPLSDREIENTTRSAYRNVRDGRRYGCSAFIDLDICVKGCPIRKL